MSEMEMFKSFLLVGIGSFFGGGFRYHRLWALTWGPVSRGVPLQ